MKLDIEVICAECGAKLTTTLEPASGVFNLKMKVVECEPCKESGEQAAIKDFEKKQKPEKVDLRVAVNHKDTQQLELEIDG